MKRMESAAGDWARLRWESAGDRGGIGSWIFMFFCTGASSPGRPRLAPPAPFIYGATNVV